MCRGSRYPARISQRRVLDNSLGAFGRALLIGSRTCSMRCCRVGFSSWVAERPSRAWRRVPTTDAGMKNAAPMVSRAVAKATKIKTTMKVSISLHLNVYDFANPEEADCQHHKANNDKCPPYRFSEHQPHQLRR